MGKNGFRTFEYESPYENILSAIRKLIEHGCEEKSLGVGPDNFIDFQPPYSTAVRPRYILVASNVPPEVARAASQGWYCRRTEIPI